MRGGVYVPWAPDAGGLWRSASLAVSFEATQPFLSVFDRDGRKIELTHEMRARAAYLEQRLDRFEQLEQRVDLYEREIVPRLAAAEQARLEAEQAVTELAQRLTASEQAVTEFSQRLTASEQARVEQAGELVASEQARLEAVRALTELSRQFTELEEQVRSLREQRGE